MKPVFQTRDNAINGNCLAASLASIFETSIDVFDIPIPDGTEWLEVINRHVINLFGSYIITIQSTNAEEFIKGYHLVLVHNDTLNAEHCMVGLNGKVVHNPSHGKSQFSNYHYGLIVKQLMSKEIVELEKERMEWALQTFPEATAVSSLRKLEAEILEIEADILNGKPKPVEYADALMCLFDSAGRSGISPQQIFEAFEKKLSINKLRKWNKNPDNTYSHIKSGIEYQCDGADLKAHH